MPIKLPAELKTNKVETLPDELKSIAEEMLAEKFDIPEEVPPNKGGSFRVHPMESAWSTGGTQQKFYGVEPKPNVGYRDQFSEMQRGYYDEIRVEYIPWKRSRRASLRIREPSFDSIDTAIRRFREENIKGRYELVMSPHFFEYLKRERKAMMHMDSHLSREFVEGEKSVITKIMGIDIILWNGLRDCSLESDF